MAKVERFSCKISRTERTCHGGMDMPVIHTPHGIVLVCISAPGFKPLFTLLDFVYGGRLYSERWDKRYSQRYCTTLAAKMVERVVERRW